ncbi:hypothetical protein SCB71_03915 [Herbiconiux sp. KACC 21604]|uniref:hypothetical protein n=1 Tax=unclassified Herbiconiux TaxID=2618217 RepID=UPI0014927582|nr:hypothetical protein [Herbiconiux sp. SALV-R1]QJU52520.1 hypothetical protein HL652_01880 [Herbiconiux sp. SALV-R1]WPO87396.1 hypothetical protein SCB71_03915 [Herbiconiux sp. KACC 21604]
MPISRGDREHIARAGTTGVSTGTHMAARGAPFGSASASGSNAAPIIPEEDMAITEDEFARQH